MQQGRLEAHLRLATCLDYARDNPPHDSYFCFDGEEGLDDNLQQMADLLVRYSGADRNTLQMGIVKGRYAAVAFVICQR